MASKIVRIGFSFFLCSIRLIKLVESGSSGDISVDDEMYVGGESVLT